MPKLNIKKLLSRAHDLIPGAAHTYSKGDDQFPAIAPKAVIRGRGAYVWCDDGKKYLDWCMGLRSVSLGHVYPVVNKAVAKQMALGTNFGRPHLIEFELADMLTKMLPHVEMVKFAKNGSTVTTAATKLARAYTGRKYIAVCKSHPFFSYDDWFIGTTACDAGIPEEIKKLTVTFTYNDLASLEKLFTDYKDQIACVIMEAGVTEEPKDDFLQKVQSLTKKNGAVFILDEMVTGFRWHMLGAAYRYKLTPDLITYGKGIANGYSVAVLGGRKDIMERGGLKHKNERVFLISTTHGAETTGLAATLATLQEMKQKKVPDYLWNTGKKIKKEVERLIKKHGLMGKVEVVGFPSNLLVNCRDENGVISMWFRTLLMQEMIRRGVLFQCAFPISFSHRGGELRKTYKALDQSLAVYKRALEDVKHRDMYLEGEPVKPVFRKFN